MQVLTEKNTVLSHELKKCKAQLEAALAAAGEPKETPSGKIHFERLVLCGVGENLTNHIVDGVRLDPDNAEFRSSHRVRDARRAHRLFARHAHTKDVDTGDLHRGNR